MGVVIMAVAGLRIRARLETRNLGFWHAILIVTGAVGTAGLLLVALLGIEAAIWAAAYLWLGALNLPKDAKKGGIGRVPQQRNTRALRHQLA